MKSIGGLDEKVVAALSYSLGLIFLGAISGIVVLVLEKENKFVRFHALQSTLWFLMLMIIGWVLSVLGKIILIGFVFNAVGALVGAVSFISAIILMVKAFCGATTKIPIIGDIVWTQINK